MKAITLDTGALISLEQNQQSISKVFESAIKNRLRMTVPAVVLAEWWRMGRGARTRERLLASMIVDPVTKRQADLAGAALGGISRLPPGIGTIDAIVVASAWLRGDVIYTSDVKDLTRIRDAHTSFAALRIEHA